MPITIISKSPQATFKYAFLLLTLVFCFNGFSQSKDSDILFEKARIEGKKENFSKAAEYCEMAMKYAPYDMDIKEYYGKCQMELGQFEEARITLLDVLKRSPKRVEARHYLLNIEFQTKRYSSAVCYANELLEITPYAKTLWMKKIQLYSLMNNKIEAHRATVRLYHIFPEDEEVRALYNNLLKEEALAAAKKQDHVKAVEQYELALKATTNDKELYLSLINAYIRIGNYDKALETANRGLYYLPTNKEIFDKKIGVLEQKQEYGKAIEAVQFKLKTTPTQEYATLLNYLLSESARFNRNSDPYELYGQLYARNPSNIEAYNYLLNTALARGFFGAAQELLHDGLRSSPNSKDLLSKQLYLYEMQQNKDGERATITKLRQLYPNDSDVAEKYNKLQYLQAKEDLNNQQFRSALPVFLSLVNHPEFGESCKDGLYTIYVAQNKYDKALEIAEDQIIRNPENHKYIIKKLDVYTKKGDYETAYNAALERQNLYPNAVEYKDYIDEISVQYVKRLQEEENFNEIIKVTDRLVFSDPYNKLAYLYSIGARLQMNQYNDAIDVAEVALMYFPNDKDFKLRLAGIYSQAKQTDESLRLLQELRNDYPFNSTIRDAYVDELYQKGKILQQNNQKRDAVLVYQQILQLKPNDSLAPIKVANILIVENELDAAMQAIDSGLVYHPENNDMIYKKAVIYEKMEDFENALIFYKKYIPKYYQLDEHRNLLDYIESRNFKNQVNMSYLRVTTDSIFLQTSVATFEYLRQWKNNVLVARYNYAARVNGIGSQLEMDWYHDFKDSASILVNAGYANRFFPVFKAGISFYQPLKKDYTLELGVRYLRFQPNRNLWMGVVGVEKTYNRYWLNLRTTLITDLERVYNSILGQGRFYMKNERNYLLAQASVGTIPEVANLDFQLNTFLSYVNTMVGAGYYHHFNYSTSMGIQGNWYTFRISQDRLENLYHFFITVRHKF